MNHQQVFRLWLSVGCIAVVCLSVFSSGQTQDAVSPNNPGQVVVQKNYFKFRTTVPRSANGTSENGYPTNPSGSSARARDSGLFSRKQGANTPGQPAAAKPVDKSKTTAAKFQKAVEAQRQAKDEEARKKSLEAFQKSSVSYSTKT
jgi:hypothetical protein